MVKRHKAFNKESKQGFVNVDANSHEQQTGLRPSFSPREGRFFHFFLVPGSNEGQ